MEKYFLLILFVIFAIWYLSYSATRLDRLHHRVETSWANLDGLLQRRAAVALEIAKSDIADPASSLLLTAAAHQARDAQMKMRSQAESGLSGALGLLLNDGHLVDGVIEKDLLRELSELTDKIRIAIAMHVDAVTRTQMVRAKPVFKIFRLAGRAPLPVTYEFEADVL
jgi:cellobiose-specific phosphotransferase system component IIA